MLVNDINLDPNLPGGQVFTKAVIAPDIDDEIGFQGTDFTGSFDGNGYIVRNMTIRAGTGNYVGLFGKIGECKVQNLGLENVSVEGSSCVGGLVGTNSGEVTNCFATGTVGGTWNIGGLAGRNYNSISNCNTTTEVTGGWDIGGLVGYNWGIITDCHARSKVNGSENIGGLIGESWGGVINCYATGEVSGKSIKLGGLIGSNIGTITYCYATGDVSGHELLSSQLGGLVGCHEGGIICCWASGKVTGAGSNGGLVGFNVNSIIENSFARGPVIGTAFSYSIGGLAGNTYEGTITNCYATGSVSGDMWVGGLLGITTDSIVKRSFWDIESSGVLESAGGVGLTTAEMQDAQTFIDAGWDMVGERANGTIDLWQMSDAGGYPELTVLSESYQPRLLEGTGTPEDPYKIATAEDLGAINHYDRSACYRLVSDIDLSGIIWRQAPIWSFNGQFDGAGFVISNLTINGEGGLGLFGSMGEHATIMNLGVEDVSIVGGNNSWELGSLAAGNTGHITNCYATGSVFGGDCSQSLGGLTGYHGGRITNCYAMVSVTGGDDSSSLGGLVGDNMASIITHCYATGTVIAGAGSTDLGGVVGYSWDSAIITDCFWDIEASGMSESDGGTGLSTAQMQTAATFRDASWDFVDETDNGTEDIWTICEGKDYPRLRWENVQCEE